MARLEATWNRLRDSFRESPIVIELKSRYSALDPKHQEWILAGALGLSALILVLLPLGLFISNWSTQNEIARIEAQTEFLNSGTSEIRELKALIAQQSTSADPSITPDSTAKEVATKSLVQAKIREDAATIEEKGSNGITLKAQKINLRQVVQLLYTIENSPAGIDIQDLDIDTQSDHDGYLWLTMSFQKRPSKANSTASGSGAAATNKFTR